MGHDVFLPVFLSQTTVQQLLVCFFFCFFFHNPQYAAEGILLRRPELRAQQMLPGSIFSMDKEVTENQSRNK